MKLDWRVLVLLLGLFAMWTLVALGPGCDGGKPRPAEFIPGRPDRGA
jgi:hypothetical protein